MSERIVDRIALPDSTTSIVLYDYMDEEFRDGRNIVKIDECGNVLWRATPPGGCSDCFMTVCMEGDEIIAHTWNCFRVRIDRDSGAVTILEFTK